MDTGGVGESGHGRLGSSFVSVGCLHTVWDHDLAVLEVVEVFPGNVARTSSIPQNRKRKFDGAFIRMGPCQSPSRVRCHMRRTRGSGAAGVSGKSVLGAELLCAKIGFGFGHLGWCRATNV